MDAHVQIDGIAIFDMTFKDENLKKVYEGHAEN